MMSTTTTNSPKSADVSHDFMAITSVDIISTHNVMSEIDGCK